MGHCAITSSSRNYYGLLLKENLEDFSGIVRKEALSNEWQVVDLAQNLELTNGDPK
jgi:hypothetical protein